LSGVAGASGILGGKLCFFPAGQRLADFVGYSSSQANEKFVSFLKRIDPTVVQDILYQHLGKYDYYYLDPLSLKGYMAVPILKNDMQHIFKSMISTISNNGGRIIPGASVVDIAAGWGDMRFKIVYDHLGELNKIWVKDSVILAPGRSGARWLGQLLDHLNIRQETESVDVGVRIEFPNTLTSKMDPRLQDPKFKIYEGSSKEVRTLCWCFGGELSITRIGNVRSIDGHFGEEISNNSSVSIVKRMVVPSGISSVAYASEQFRHLNNSIIYQNLREFIGFSNCGKLTPNGGLTPLPFHCQEKNLKVVMVRQLRESIIEIMEELDRLTDTKLITSRYGRVFAPVIDKVWNTPNLNRNLMTSIDGLYVIGDASGLGRGIVQSAFSGLIAADSILQRNWFNEESAFFPVNYFI
jgi:uncharacterized FAD-dependent dehydrogenase